MQRYLSLGHIVEAHHRSKRQFPEQEIIDGETERAQSETYLPTTQEDLMLIEQQLQLAEASAQEDYSFSFAGIHPPNAKRP